MCVCAGKAALFLLRLDSHQGQGEVRAAVPLRRPRRHPFGARHAHREGREPPWEGEAGPGASVPEPSSPYARCTYTYTHR